MFKNLKEKGERRKKKQVNFKESDGRPRASRGSALSDSESSDYEEPEEPRKRPAQRLLETIKNEKKEAHIKSSKKATSRATARKPKKQMSDDDKKKIAELMKRLRS